MALICKIELSQTDGITITVINDDAKITQTAKFNGTSIVHTCKGESDTSTITQTCDSITVKCKNYTVDAETINCTSSLNTRHQAKGTFTASSTGNSTYSSAADMTISTANKLDMNCTDFDSAAKNSTKITALTTTVNGDQKVNVTALELALSAQAQANMDGATVKVSAQSTMNVEGLTTTVKGQMTNIQGSLIKLG